MRYKILLSVIFCFLFLIKTTVFAVEPTPIPCNNTTGQPDLTDQERAVIEPYANTYDEWTQNPLSFHYFITDQEVTNQGKADERARQFIYWTLQKNSIDDHPVLKNIWSQTRNITYFLLILVVAVMGLGMIIARKNNFDLKLTVWPSVYKILGLLLFVTFSFAIVITVIQLTNYLMSVFNNNLGGKDLFKIYFSATGQDANYVDFVGCRDLNIKVQESVRAGLFLQKVTNITYYTMGIMLILRKIILWFLIFVAPFLAILMPFVFIRNIGWIWIGVFFQWVFYGPLFSLFLGATATIWKAGIPFIFDFSRVGSNNGYTFPTGMNILYGGPAQHVSFLNTANYIDTFAEYIIALIMLWATIVIPWLLLRIFRDYCCEGIYAMKNVLISMYDQMRGSPTHPPTPPSITPIFTSGLNIPKNIEIPVKLKIETIEEIKKVNTEDISKSLNLKATRLTDIARIETTKDTQTSIKQNLDYLANPQKAQTPTERQRYMNLRTELYNRAVKDDRLAKQILSTVSTSKFETSKIRENIIKNIPQAVPITDVISVRVKIPQDKISSVNNTIANTLSSNNTVVSNISQKAQIPPEKVQSILTAYKESFAQTPQKIVDNIAQKTGVSKEKVSQVLKDAINTVKTDQSIFEDIAQKEGMSEKDLNSILQTQLPVVIEPEKHIEQLIPVPETLSIEDYEEVKKMWVQQYEQGEIPLSDNIKTRGEWLETDIVFITNTLNKLLSVDESLRQEGLNDMGYVLPLFVINNIKGEELLVYLKAKLEAAKAVQEQIEKEAEIKQKLQKESQEELVEVPTKKSEEKTKEMQMEVEEKSEIRNPKSETNSKPK